MKVFLHTRPEGSTAWVNEHRDFARIPTVGEHLALSERSTWYAVQLVVHTPFPCECDAEVYAVEVDHEDAKLNAFRDLR